MNYTNNLSQKASSPWENASSSSVHSSFQTSSISSHPLTPSQSSIPSPDTLPDHIRAVVYSAGYMREYYERDMLVLQWLYESERTAWVTPFLAILELPHNTFRQLDFNDLQEILTKLSPPTDLNDLASIFGGMSL